MYCYRYGYQGSEKDDEVKGDGNSYTTHFRQLDPRVGRWMSIDPKAKSMPWQSPYCSMDNNPILYNDVFGDSISGITDGRFISYVANGFSEKAFKAFFETEKGREYVGKYAKKGQILYGYTFEVDGEYHLANVDATWTANNIAKGYNGQTLYSVENGRLSLSFVSSTALWSDTDGQNLIQARENPETTSYELGHLNKLYIIARAETITHETLLHGDLFVDDFKFDGKISHSHMSESHLSAGGYSPHHWYADEAANNTEMNQNFTIDGRNIIKELHKKYQTGVKQSEVWSRMWDFGY